MTRCLRVWLAMLNASQSLCEKKQKKNKNRSQTAQTDPVETIHKLVRLSQLLICHEGRRLDDR